MSGGSLNYLYSKEVCELFNNIESLERAESYLLEQDIYDIAKDVRRLIEYIKTARNRIEVLHEELQGIFHAIEWNMSGDYSYSSVLEEIEKYRSM